MAGFWVNRASRTIVRILDAQLRPLGLAMSHLPVLRALAEGGAQPQKALAELARVEQPTMAELLARMEQYGLVRRGPNPADRRGSLLSVTRLARARLPRAIAMLVACERAATAGFSDEERAMLVALLRRIVDNLERSGALGAAAAGSARE